uniref:Uncharacterized protein n=1 Tax=Corvus moneduloides TaxID=1196302 RepID=A0A8C3ETK2_CORMO
MIFSFFRVAAVFCLAASLLSPSVAPVLELSGLLVPARSSRGRVRGCAGRAGPRRSEERAGTSSPDNSNTGATEGESKDAARQKTAATRKKEKIIVTKTLGIVKWYNVKQNYGFITRCDNQQDIFVHRTAIKKNNPEKCIPSLGDGEVVEFKIIRGRKGLQASQVTGPDG